MKPVDQTTLGYPEGNCLMACVASILEVDLSSGRAFDEDGKDVGHCVVCLDGEMVHDPHPDKTGLAGPIEDWILLERADA